MTYSTDQVCKATGLTYRQLDYACRLGVLAPLVADANGSGTQRLWTAEQIKIVRLYAKLRDLGAPVTVLKPVIRMAELLPPEDWADLWLLVTPDAAIDLTNTVMLDRAGAGWFVRLATCLDDEMPQKPRLLDLVSR